MITRCDAVLSFGCYFFLLILSLKPRRSVQNTTNHELRENAKEKNKNKNKKKKEEAYLISLPFFFFLLLFLLLPFIYFNFFLPLSQSIPEENVALPNDSFAAPLGASKPIESNPVCSPLLAKSSRPFKPPSYTPP